jgi:hypothetical protein
MKAPIYEANLDIIVTGVMPGVNEEHVPLWTKAIDVVMEASGVRPSPGYVLPFADNGFFDDQAGNFDDYAGLFDDATSAVFLEVLQNKTVKGVHVQRQADGRFLIVWGTDSDLFTFDGTTTVNASRVGGYTGFDAANEVVATTQWSFAQWGDWVLATNGSDTPQVLKAPGATDFVDLANFPCDTAQIVRVLGPHVLFMNLSGTYVPTATPAETNGLVFSASGNPEGWDPATFPTAGYLPVKDLPGGILAAEHLGGNIILYSESASQILQYGGQFLFSSLPGAQGIRPLGKNAIASIGARHLLLTLNGIIGTDGLSFTQLAYPALGAWLEGEIDRTQRSRIAHQVDVRRSQVKWSVPGVNENFVLVYNWQTDKISFERRPFSAGTRVESVWFPLAGFTDGSVQMLVDAPNDRLPELETKPLLIGNRTRHAFIDALVGRWSGGLATVEVRYAENQDELANLPWESLGTFSQKENILWAMREAMFVQFRITSSGLKWLLSGLEILGSGGGGRL